MLLKEGMTAEEAEQVRETRLSGESEKVSDEPAKAIPSQITPGMTAEEAEAVRKARLGETSEPQSDEPAKDAEPAKKTPPKSAQVFVGTKAQFVRTNPPKEASSPKSVVNALKNLAMGSGKKTEPTRSLLGRGETSLSKLVTSNQGGVPVQKAAAPVEKRSLKDLLSNEKPTGSGRKTSSKLGGIASPEEKPIKEERKQAMKEEVIAAATAAPVAEKKPASAAAVVSSLSQLVKSGSSSARRPADGLGRGQAPSSKLGGIAGEVEPSVKQQKVMNAAKPLAQADTATDDAAPVKNADDKEAFQRSLLAARIANESKASAEPSVNVKPASSSLTDIILGQERPALAQQNVGKRNSLFPAKKESRLSRLLQK